MHLVSTVSCSRGGAYVPSWNLNIMPAGEPAQDAKLLVAPRACNYACAASWGGAACQDTSMHACKGAIGQAHLQRRVLWVWRRWHCQVLRGVTCDAGTARP